MAPDVLVIPGFNEAAIYMRGVSGGLRGQVINAIMGSEHSWLAPVVTTPLATSSAILWFSLLQVDAAVLESRLRRLRGDALCYALRCGPRALVEPYFVVILGSRTGPPLFHLAALMALLSLHRHFRSDRYCNGSSVGG